jgi:GTPase
LSLRSPYQSHESHGISSFGQICDSDWRYDCSHVLHETKQGINRFLKYPGIRRLPFNIKSEDDILTSIKNIYTESITPIFYVSNTTGEGVDHLKYFFNKLNN